MRKKITGPFKWERRGDVWQRYFDGGNCRMQARREERRWKWWYERINGKGHVFYFCDGIAGTRAHCERIGNALAKVVK